MNRELTLEHWRKVVQTNYELQVPPQVISDYLQGQGILPQDADKMVYNVFMEEKKVSSLQLLRGLFAGFLAAFLGAALWAGMIELTGKQYVLAVILIALGCAQTVVYCAGGKKGINIMVAVFLTNTLCFFLVKYYTLYYAIKLQLSKSPGKATMVDLSLVSVKMIKLYQEVLPRMIQGSSDVIWLISILVCMSMAYRTPAQGERFFLQEHRRNHLFIDKQEADK